MEEKVVCPTPFWRASWAIFSRILHRPELPQAKGKD
ncbi:hypothetical protein J437_LFUL006440 [Ladona fulva]|uniref:Uncharacterized protein n=1 Tax=Ladona fulva TaxID=123851 RepID=A0A8K0K054_LADFU|nr:hypothetical protein J437_LFUL006440 [Ladona fulva]